MRILELIILEKIISLHNQHVKDWKKLLTRKQRKKTGTYLLDGWHLINEALTANVNVKSLIITSDQLEEHDDIVTRDFPIYEVTDEIMRAITDTVTPQGIAAEVELPTDQFDIPESSRGAWLFLDQVQDPGNIGTMVRTADAAGFTGVVAGSKTADLYSPKVVRSMQGSQFHLTLRHGNLDEWIELFKKQHFPIYGTQLNPEAKNFRDVAPAGSFALVMGNEGNGLSDNILSQTTSNLYIPMNGRAESLNVAVSAGILMFQLNQNIK